MSSIPAGLLSPSRMQLNVIELSKRDSTVKFKDIVLKDMGDLSAYTILHADVLVATYIKPSKTSGGVYLPDKSAEEDRWQGKIGLVLKLGESAFKYGPWDGTSYEYKGTIPKIGDYVAFHTSDTREIGVRGFSCRTVDSQLIRMIVPDPDSIY